MRGRLVVITALMLSTIAAVAFALAYELRSSQRELVALWMRVDDVADVLRMAAANVGRIESQWPGQVPEQPAALRISIDGLVGQVEVLRARVSDTVVQSALNDMRLAMAELSARLDAAPTGPLGLPAATADIGAAGGGRATTRLRGAFDRVWMRIGELNSADISRFALAQQRVTGRLLLVILLAAITGSGLVAFQVWQVSNVLRDFIHAARRLAAGNWSYRLDPPQTRELRALAESFNQMADAIAQAEARRTEAAREMIVTVNHEVGNATASISGLVQLLRRHEVELPAGVVSSLSKIQDTVDRLARTVSRLRDVSSLRVADYPGGLKMFEVGEPAGSGGSVPGETPANR